MMANYFYPMSNWMFNWMYGWAPLVWLTPFIIIDLILKGIALWKAGRNNHLYWFIALLFINSMGILPLIYLAFFKKKKK